MVETIFYYQNLGNRVRCNFLQPGHTVAMVIYCVTKNDSNMFTNDQAGFGFHDCTINCQNNGYNDPSNLLKFQKVLEIVLSHHIKGQLSCQLILMYQYLPAMHVIAESHSGLVVGSRPACSWDHCVVFLSKTLILAMPPSTDRRINGH